MTNPKPHPGDRLRNAPWTPALGELFAAVITIRNSEPLRGNRQFVARVLAKHPDVTIPELVDLADTNAKTLARFLPPHLAVKAWEVARDDAAAHLAVCNAALDAAWTDLAAQAAA